MSGKDENKTKAELIEELNKKRQEIAEVTQEIDEAKAAEIAVLRADNEALKKRLEEMEKKIAVSLAVPAATIDPQEIPDQFDPDVVHGYLLRAPVDGYNGQTYGVRFIGGMSVLGAGDEQLALKIQSDFGYHVKALNFNQYQEALREFQELAIGQPQRPSGLENMQQPMIYDLPAREG